MSAAAYLRVSSRSQSLAMQRSAIVRAARARGDRIRWWFEEKVSGASPFRAELHNVREAVRAGRVSKLYVYRLDRLSRAGIRDTLQTLEELRTGGCKVETVADGFSLEGPMSEVVIAVMAWAAQMERLAIGERVAGSYSRAKAEGRPWGRPKRVTEREIAQMLERRGEGDSIRDIAIAMKIPKTTVAAVVSGKGPYARARDRRTKRGRAPAAA